MPPTGVKSRKRARQYGHIKESAKKQGRSTARAKQIAAATVNRQRREAGETKGSRKGSAKKKTSGGRKKTSSRKTASRKSASRKTASRKSSSRRAPSRETSRRKTASRKKR